MTITLPALPYELDALEPHISAETLKLHHGKHHKAYVDHLNEAIAGTAYATQTLEEIVAGSQKNGDVEIFHNAAQAWNHGFYWNCLRGKPGKGASGDTQMITCNHFGERDFGLSAIRRDPPRGLGGEIEQRSDRLAGRGAGAQFENLTEQDERHDDASRFVIDGHHAVHLERVGKDNRVAKLLVIRSKSLFPCPSIMCTKRVLKVI